MVITSVCYACKCLNVRIFALSACSTDSHLSLDDDWVPVCVADDGIIIAHNEFTLRTRSKPFPDPKDASRHTRYMSLICMPCQFPVYRVLQSIYPDSEGKEGPVLPTDEWVEKDALKTRSGKLEVHKGCLTREEIVQAESQPSFSRTFRIVLPYDTAPLPAPSSQLPSSSDSSSEALRVLPPLSPLFLPPPFTPSHPAFLYIASVATAESVSIRAAAEEYLVRVTKDTLRQIEEQEIQIRRQTEMLWSKFREASDRFETEKRDISCSRKRDSGKWTVNTQGTNPPVGSPGNVVSVNDFIPSHVVPPRSSVSPGSLTPRTSALSASLAATSFHHPRDQQSRDGSRRSTPSISDTSSHGHTPRSLSTASSKTLSAPNFDSGTNDILEPFRRDMNEAKDIATSLLVLDLEAAMEQRRRQRSSESSAPGPSHAGPSTQPEPSQTNAKKNEPPQSGDMSADQQSPLSPKGKRKVTFDVEPDIVTIKRDVTREKDEILLHGSSGDKRHEISVFDLEDELNGGVDPEVSDGQPSTSGLTLDPPPSLVQRRRQKPRSRQSSGAGLPQSLSSLRPNSLPAPFSVGESIRIAAHEPNTTLMDDSVPSQQHDLETTKISEVDEEEVIPGVAEMMKLVAANIPSHRGAWRKDSKAWKLFMDKQINETNANDDGGVEVGEAITTDQLDDEYGWNVYKPPDSIAQSLPVSIGTPRARNPNRQMKTTLADRPGLSVADLPVSKYTSEAQEEASYAEGDQSREIDSDLAVPSDADEDDGESGDVVGDMGEGRGRRRALRILQARSEIPEAGMWRSLA